MHLVTIHIWSRTAFELHKYVSGHGHSSQCHKLLAFVEQASCLNKMLTLRIAHSHSLWPRSCVDIAPGSWPCPGAMVLVTGIQTMMSHGQFLIQNLRVLSRNQRWSKSQNRGKILIMARLQAMPVTRPRTLAMLLLEVPLSTLHCRHCLAG